MDLPFPFGGRSEQLPTADQSPGTTRSEQNVHGVDPLTGEMSGASRRGLTTHSGGSVGTGQIQAMETIVYDQKTVSPRWGKILAGRKARAAAYFDRAWKAPAALGASR